ncbi:Protein of unknown function DUF509 [Methanococcus vannielii SB]|jgi:tRNA threonylcarbamoyladenosine modification (KEOPS) complex Cgi121 subunit|uniref:KEOPS complex Cgi121-like subunit n=1 Tax=Methanococcus vannielii (strain ATCC 35089 / DSM 1224 / JCM 13029 / OCM 148 / SB) TaxID=406327 RepID=A6UNX7_METVS|nr:KEOPS complex subunit Cgi121 [Methanococcus vannielii]ABR54199.1 Protein of unknown function DUF509 [Methanococcus vannielii SB]
MIIKGVKNSKVPEEIFKMNLEFQLLNADLIATKTHILQGIYQAETKKNISSSIWVEILLRISGTKQISNAIKTFGAKSGNVCIICKDLETFQKILDLIGGTLDDEVLELNEYKEDKIKTLFDIKNCKNLVERVCEKVALIEVI